MTNQTDSFIDEVTEEVRRDKLFGYLRRYGWVGILVILVLVGGAAYTEWRRAQETASARALGDSIYEAATVEDASDQAQALTELDVSGPASAPALMLEAAALVEAGEIEEAAARLDALAVDQSHPRVWRDLAALKRLSILGQALSPEDRLTALAPLTVPGAPYRALALEQQALAEFDSGNHDAALATLQSLLTDQEAPQGLRSRVLQLIVALGPGPDET